MSADPSELISRTEDLFVARSLEDDARAEAVSIRFIDIYRFLTEAGFTLPHAQQAVLFSNERIRRDFQQLRKDLAARLHRTVVPVAAAASDGTLTERRFPGGVIRLAASAVDSQHMYVMFEFEGQAPSFRAIELQGAGGDLMKMALDPPDEDGLVQTLLDLRREDHAAIVRLLQDPNTQGSFL
jgi:hypothetical protein